MTDVAVASIPLRHDDSISAIEASGIRTTAPAIEMVRNPAFSFPMKPLSPAVSNEPSAPAPRRPTSMFLQPVPATTAHKRNASALPTFSFNASDTSGRQDATPPQTPDENTLGLETPAARKGHRRGGSEFVGGDSRFGVKNAITTSPTKIEVPQFPEPGHSPAGRRHAHRRSVAVSSHDLSQIMSAADKSPRLSSSLPSSPLDMRTLSPAPVLTPSAVFRQDDDNKNDDDNDNNDEEASQPRAGDSPVRPPSRPRVEFVEHVEIIPRPLSTISSETESSISTVIGQHSISNSISSVLSLGSPPSSSHARVPSVGHASVGSIAEPRTKHRSSIEISRRVEKEGEWLKARPSPPLEQSAPVLEPSSITIDEPHAPKRQKRLSHGFGFDRRRSEPLISSTASDFTRLSALSLQEVMARDNLRPTTSSEAIIEKRSSSQKLKQWALSKLHRRHSRQQAPVVEAIVIPRSNSADSVDVPGKVSRSPDVMAETDLDAVFGHSAESLSPRFGTSPTQMTFDNPSPLLESSTSSIIDLDDGTPMVDLDAALGPLRVPALPHRRHMHSDRPSKAAGASTFLHRRAESEPVLMSFNYNRAGSNAQKSMEDVFEEEEEDAQAGEEAGMGITMVDADRSAFDPANPESLRLRRAARDSDRPSTSYISSTSQLPPTPATARPASLVDDVIVEEAASPPDATLAEIEIVEAHEEPRAASLEKSSDSSEASTLLGSSTLPLPDGGVSPETYHSSSFGSPDFTRRQGSFDVSRGGTSASSITDTRTTSSCTTGEPGHEMRMSVDDVPSLTSSRSTMLSTTHANNSRRDVTASRVYEAVPRIAADPSELAARRKKRASIQSLSQLVGGTFGSRSKLHDESRPQTAALTAQPQVAKKKEHRLKKLMFWRSKQNLRQAAAADAGAV